MSCEAEIPGTVRTFASTVGCLILNFEEEKTSSRLTHWLILSYLIGAAAFLLLPSCSLQIQSSDLEQTRRNSTLNYLSGIERGDTWTHTLKDMYSNVCVGKRLA